MSFIESFPQEVTCLILERIDYPTLLTAKYVAKNWNEAIIPFLKEIRERIGSRYFPGILMTDNTFFNKHVITSIEESLVDRIQKFLGQLKTNNQSGKFSVVFPFNPGQTKLDVEIKKADQENKEFDKKEIVIFMKKIEEHTIGLSGASWSHGNTSLRSMMPYAYFHEKFDILRKIEMLLQKFSF